MKNKEEQEKNRPFTKSNSRLYRYTWEPKSEDAYGAWSWGFERKKKKKDQESQDVSE